MRFWSVLVLAFLFFSCDHPESQKYERYSNHESTTELSSSNESNEVGYKLIGIKDGDTFVLFIDGREQTVRLAHIDCPEKKQPFGSRAKQFASDLCFDEYVTLVNENKYDRNKRLISEIILSNGINVNQELVRNGLAWHFKKYSDNEDYALLENEARQKRIGIWSDPNPVSPWEWRKSRRKQF